MDESQTFRTPAVRQRASSVRPVIMAVIAAFALGIMVAAYLASTGWFDRNAFFSLRGDDSGSDAQAGTVPPPLPRGEATAARAMVQEARQATQRVEQVVQQQGGLDQRVAAMEQRLARLDLQAQAASGNAARAEGLLIAFAARRAIDRAAPLGYLGDQLRLRFGGAQPEAVQTIIDASQDPVTLDQLVARLDGLAPTLVDAPASENALDWIGRELSELFVVRTQDMPSPAADKRLERARLFLEIGRIELAISEIRHVPNAGEARDWLADAERYAAAQRALEVLETTAVLEPRQLRDGDGRAVEQLSPVSGN